MNLVHELEAARLGLRARIETSAHLPHLIVYHRADHDGVFSAAIVSSALYALGVKSVSLLGWDFGDGIIVPSAQYADVWVVDLPVDRVLHEPDVSKIVWIDHHSSNIDAETRPFAGYRSTELSAAALCWHLLVSSELPELVLHVDRWDRWEHEGYGDKSVDVHYGLMCKLTLDDPDFAVGVVRMGAIDEMVKGTIGSPGRHDRTPARANDDTVFDLASCGRTVQDFWRAQMDSHCVPVMHYGVFHGIRFKILNSCIRGSIVFGSQEGGYQMVWAYVPSGQIRVSMYAGKDVSSNGVDLSEIATKYGGGGHRNACGFQCDPAAWFGMLEDMKNADAALQD